MSESGHTFYFDGVDVETFNIYYAPEVNGTDTYVWAPGQSKTQEQIFESHNGGYYFGSNKEPKPFNLRCYYFQTPQTTGLMGDIFKFFKIGRRGRLSFEERPWIYYNVVITNIDINTMYNFQNGLVTIQCKAYIPYGFTDKEYNDYPAGSEEYVVCKKNSNMLDAGSSYPQKNFTNVTIDGNVGRDFQIYNYGTEQTPLIVTLSGTSTDGLTLTANNTKCEIQPFTNITNLTVDGTTGKTSVNGTLAFQYHKAGFVLLEPLMNTIHVSSNTTVTLSNLSFNFAARFD